MITVEIRGEAVTDAVRAEVARLLDGDARMRVKTDTSGGMADAVDCLWNALFFRVYADGAPVAFYALRFRKKGALVHGEVTIAHGRAGFDLVRYVLPLIEQQCGHCAALRIETKRAGLMKKLERAGYGHASTILEKRLCAS